ncbi:MAG: glycerol-3-phosphate ABC transporter ATP-binding protein [Rhizobiales bacterium 12-68-15]|nr:MAG: glycerol-3-phosphate ABC transporter ATP-binding protein [Rhizobiales bacterium 12-68-15]
MAVVKLDTIVKRYGHAGPVVVENVDLTIADGEFMVLLGPSGCGKSTTLRMIAGLETISSGTLSIDGRVVNDVPAKDRDIAMVFQSYALYPHMSVADNLAFGLRRRAIPATEVQRRVGEVAAILGLAPLLARKPSALSGGQRQRVALGRAMVREPQVFLFDEPLSNLDAALRVNTRSEIIKQHHRLGSTMIYVTHDQVARLSAAERRARSGALDAPLGRWSDGTLLAYDGRDVTLGVRAEDMVIDPAVLGAAPYGSVTGRTIAVEPLGAETLLLLELEGGGEITARLPRHVSAAPEQIVTLHFRPEAVYLFDSTTGDAVSTQESDAAVVRAAVQRRTH